MGGFWPYRTLSWVRCYKHPANYANSEKGGRYRPNMPQHGVLPWHFNRKKGNGYAD